MQIYVNEGGLEAAEVLVVALQAKTKELSLCTRLKLTQLLEAGIGDVT
jgi:hypothetical protein